MSPNKKELLKLISITGRLATIYEKADHPHEHAEAIQLAMALLKEGPVMDRLESSIRADLTKMVITYD